MLLWRAFIFKFPPPLVPLLTGRPPFPSVRTSPRFFTVSPPPGRVPQALCFPPDFFYPPTSLPCLLCKAQFFDLGLPSSMTVAQVLSLPKAFFSVDPPCTVFPFFLVDALMSKFIPLFFPLRFGRLLGVPTPHLLQPSTPPT